MTFAFTDGLVVENLLIQGMLVSHTIHERQEDTTQRWTREGLSRLRNCSKPLDVIIGYCSQLCRDGKYDSSRSTLKNFLCDGVEQIGLEVLRISDALRQMLTRMDKVDNLRISIDEIETYMDVAIPSFQQHYFQMYKQISRKRLETRVYKLPVENRPEMYHSPENTLINLCTETLLENAQSCYFINREKIKVPGNSKSFESLDPYTFPTAALVQIDILPKKEKNLTFTFRDGFVRNFTLPFHNIHETFEFAHHKGDYLIQVQTRQDEILGILGIRFLTSLGRSSGWIGCDHREARGEVRNFLAKAGDCIVNLYFYELHTGVPENPRSIPLLGGVCYHKVLTIKNKPAINIHGFNTNFQPIQEMEIPAHCVLASVRVHYGKRVEHICFNYANGESRSIGDARAKVKHRQLFLLQDELLQCVLGTNDEEGCIGIEFVTNKHRRSPWYGRDGAQKDMALTMNADSPDCSLNFQFFARPDFCLVGLKAIDTKIVGVHEAKVLAKKTKLPILPDSFRGTRLTQVQVWQHNGIRGIRFIFFSGKSKLFGKMEGTRQRSLTFDSDDYLVGLVAYNTTRCNGVHFYSKGGMSTMYGDRAGDELQFFSVKGKCITGLETKGKMCPQIVGIQMEPIAKPLSPTHKPIIETMKVNSDGIRVIHRKHRNSSQERKSAERDWEQRHRAEDWQSPEDYYGRPPSKSDPSNPMDNIHRKAAYERLNRNRSEEVERRQKRFPTRYRYQQPRSAPNMRRKPPYHQQRYPYHQYHQPKRMFPTPRHHQLPRSRRKKKNKEELFQDHFDELMKLINSPAIQRRQLREDGLIE